MNKTVEIKTPNLVLKQVTIGDFRCIYLDTRLEIDFITLEEINGVTDVMIINDYYYKLLIGKMFSLEEVCDSITEKLTPDKQTHLLKELTNKTFEVVLIKDVKLCFLELMKIKGISAIKKSKNPNIFIVEIEGFSMKNVKQRVSNYLNS